MKSFEFKDGSRLELHTDQDQIELIFYPTNRGGVSVILYHDDGALQWFKKTVMEEYQKSQSHKPKKNHPHLRLVSPSENDEES